jgi:putative tricarboxylic transport membrane protein
MAVAFAFGLLGVAMRRGGYPAAPLLLAMILGGMAEENLRRMLIVSSGSATFLFTRPIAVAMLLVSAASVVAGLLRGRRARAASADGAGGGR